MCSKMTRNWRKGRLLTFDLERTPPVESIQMYLWGRLEPRTGRLELPDHSLCHSTSLLVEGHVLEELQKGQPGYGGVNSEIGNALTLAVYETVVEDAIIAVLRRTNGGGSIVCCERRVGSTDRSRRVV